jgi:preprotein translocase subunit SecG
MDLGIVENLLLLVHVLGALAIIGLVLIQHGKGADAGAGLGAGASATVFGSGGAGNFLTRTTTWIAILFFLTSFGLAWFARQHAVQATDLGIPKLQEVLVVPADTSFNESELPDLGSDSTVSVPAQSEESEIPR